MCRPAEDRKTFPIMMNIKINNLKIWPNLALLARYAEASLAGPNNSNTIVKSITAMTIFVVREVLSIVKLAAPRSAVRPDVE